MRRWVFAFFVCFLFLSASGSGQSAADESGLQALVAEVRLHRKDLQAANGNALKAQVLLNRLQFQQGAVARVSGSLNDARGRIFDIQRRRAEVEASVKRFEESRESEPPPGNRKEIEGLIETNKAELEALATQEQQAHTAEMEAEEQLLTEQAKLNVRRGGENPLILNSQASFAQTRNSPLIAISRQIVGYFLTCFTLHQIR